MLWKRFARIRTILLVTALLSIPLVLLYTKRRAPGYDSFLVEPIVDLSLMIQGGFAIAIGSMVDKVFALSAAFDSHDELVRLRAQNTELEGLKISLSEIHAENIRIKALLDFSQRFSLGRAIGSHVIGRTGAPLSRIIQIDKGRDQGVNRGDAVISAAGAVGQILSAGRSYSDVLLLTDASSAVDILVQRTRARGLLNGVNGARNYRIRVNDFDRLHEVEKGDIIVTSGMGAQFPAGVPVGEVISIKQRPDSLYVEAEIKPYTQFDSLEDVVILADGGLEKPWTQNELAMEKLQKSIGPAVKGQN